MKIAGELASLVPLIRNEILKKQTVCSSPHWLCLHILDSNVDNVQNLSPRIPQWFEIFSEGEFVNSTKGVFSKPSGDCIVAPNFCFLS